MFSEARKLHLMEEVLKIKNENILIEMELLLKKLKRPQERQKQSARDFSGIWDKADAQLIEKAIEEGCETINPDDWK